MVTPSAPDASRWSLYSLTLIAVVHSGVNFRRILAPVFTLSCFLSIMVSFVLECNVPLCHLPN